MTTTGDAVDAFTISVEDAVLNDLRLGWRGRASRIRSRVRGGSTGSPSTTCARWSSTGGTRTAGAAKKSRLNALPHFRTRIDGQSIHFVHARSAQRRCAAPSPHARLARFVSRVFRSIPRLTDPEARGGRAGDAFHVIAPSLPGYGFSEAPRTRGWDVGRMADAFTTLMARLGYARYAAQGGDWGAQITTRIAAFDPAHCAAIHLNMPIGRPPEETGPSDRRGGGRPGGAAAVPARGVGVRRRAGHQAADPGRLSQRLTGRAAGLDRREVPRGGVTATAIPRTPTPGTNSSPTSCCTG